MYEAMNKLQLKGMVNERQGLQKQQEACRKGSDDPDCIEAKEEALTGKLQRRMGKGDEEIEEMIDEEDEKHEA